MKVYLILLLQQATDPTDIGPIVAVIAARALMLTSLVNPLVNLLAKAWLRLSGPILPFVAMVLAFILDVLFMVIVGQPFNMKGVALAVVTGVATGIGSKVVQDVAVSSKPS